MSTSNQPSSVNPPPLQVRIRQLLQKSISPHASILDEGERRRAQLLGILSLIETVFTLVGGIAASSHGIFPVLTGFSLLTYVISRTRFYYIGAYIFTYSLASIAFIRIYQGAGSSVESSISTFVHIALILASALLSQVGFAVLTILATVATFSVPLYSKIPVNSLDNIPRAGGIVLTLGILLFGIDLILASLDRARLKKLHQSNQELEDIKMDLEKRIDQRTNELRMAGLQMEKRAIKFQSISEISQSITGNIYQSFQELLLYITRSISEKTGFYHVGIFLLNENRDYVVLHAANSPGGKIMLERHHQLKAGGTGIVGYVAQSGRPRLALDTGRDAVFFNNPDLPDTRSEMALPLKVGTETIGVLDIQSINSSAFNEEDVITLSTLTNQIAIIIQNAQLRQGGELISPAQSTRRDGRMIKTSRPRGFTFNPDGTLASAARIENSNLDKVFESGDIVISDRSSPSGVPTLTVPVKFRDQIIGVINIESADGKRKWTEDEVIMVQAVSERAALALENASLFEATERRAEQERVITDVTTRIGESKEVEHILQTTIQELGRTLGTSRAFIQLGTSAVPPNEES